MLGLPVVDAERDDELPDVDVLVADGVVQELRNAGAEVIQVGDVRVVASTSFTTAEDGTLLVDGTSVPAPFEVLAIGDPTVM